MLYKMFYIDFFKLYMQKRRINLSAMKVWGNAQSLLKFLHTVGSEYATNRKKRAGYVQH